MSPNRSALRLGEQYDAEVKGFYWLVPHRPGADPLRMKRTYVRQ